LIPCCGRGFLKFKIMSNTTRFIVEIVSSEKIVCDYDIDEMAQRIANAIVNGTNTFSIHPDGSDAYTETVYVKGWYSDRQIIEHP